jgi:uncharacterized membrane protein
MIWKNKFLNKNEEKQIENQIEDFENKTGAELLLIVAKASDPYPAATLRFAIISSFLITIILTMIFEFDHITYIPFVSIIILAIMIVIGRFKEFKSLTLSKLETDRETDEKAAELFYIFSSSKTHHNQTCMLYISLLERKIHLKIDSALKEKITQAELEEMIFHVSKEFQEEHFSKGIIDMIQVLEKKILEQFPETLGKSPNKLHNKIEWVNFS